MNFLSMKYFLALSEEKNFTKAAEKLHITQQTLSAHIANLEQEAGTKLFIRSTPLRLTVGGEVFLRYARMFARNELSLRRELSDASGENTGTLRIGIAFTRGRVLLPEVIMAFQEKYPKISIELHEMANEHIWSALKRDKLDIAMARLQDEIPGIIHEPWMKEEIVLLVNRKLAEKVLGAENIETYFHPGRKEKALPEAFSNCPFLINSEEDIAGSLARKLFRDGGMEPRIAVASENLATLLRLTVFGRGAYLCPLNLAEHILTDEEKKQLLTMHFEEGTYTMSFGYHKQKRQWNILSAWMETVRETVLPASST